MMNSPTTISSRFLTLTTMFLLTVVYAAAVLAQPASVDLSFNAVPEKNLTAASAVDFILQPDNKVIVFGDFQALNGTVSKRVARLNPDGTGDNSFSCVPCDLLTVLTVTLQSDGNLIIAGYSGLQPAIYRLNPDGTLDTSFVSTLTRVDTERMTVERLTAQADGQILVLVQRRSENPFINPNFFRDEVRRLSPNGAVDTTFTPIVLGGNGGQLGITGSNAGKASPLADGKILAVTNFYNHAPGQNPGIARMNRYNSDGTLDPTFGTAEVDYIETGPNDRFPGTIDDFELHPDGSVIIVGTFSVVNGVVRHSVARLLLPAGNVDLSFNTNTTRDIVQAKRVEIAVDGTIFVGTATKIYRLHADGSLDPTFNSASELTQIKTWTLDSAGRIIVNYSINKFARLNNDGSIEFSFTLSSGTAGSISAIASQADGKVVFTGDFLRVNGVPRASAARVNANGTLDETFDTGTGFNGSVTKLLMQSDEKILVIGSFGAINSISRVAIARINADGEVDDEFAPVVAFNSVRAIALQADGKILIGGTFTSVNGEARTGIARLDQNGIVDPSFNPIIGSPSILSIAVQVNGQIMVGGTFSGVNGFSRTNMVRLNADGSLDPAFTLGTPVSVRQVELANGSYIVLTSNKVVRLNDTGAIDSGFISLEFSSPPNKILVRADGTIIVGGNFNAINGNMPRFNIARLTPHGSVDDSFLPQGANAEVKALERQADGRILVGGNFSVIGGVTRLGIARLNISPYRLNAQFDFDGDGRADVAVFRPSNGHWYQFLSQNNAFNAFQWGQAGDRLAPADYDGDGRTDVAVFRDSVPGGGNFAYFYIYNSSDGSIVAEQFGATGDVPLTGDWDGDGKADLGVYRDGSQTGEQSYFYYRPSGSPGVDFHAIPWGTTGDKPIMGDFDGDAKLDAAVFRPSNQRWYILRSSNGQVTQLTFGLSTDILVPADYNGDGRTDIAVFRPSTGTWYTSTNPQTNYGAIHFGASGDVPVPADYDGDGKADVAVFRPSSGIWYMLNSTQGFTGLQFGISEDKPIPNAFVP